MEETKLLKQLIKIKSYSAGEDQLKKFIKSWFTQNKIKSFDQDENLLVYVKGKDKTKTFIFNSHLDTVSEGSTPWKYGAFKPTEKGKKLIGLGASDMKSGLASSMLLAKQMTKTVPPIDMWFTYVVKEEIDGSGTKSFAEWFKKEGYAKRYKDMAGIFTEPTNLREIEHGHRGNIFLMATSKGDSGHSSKPSLIKKHAVREMIKFSDSLKKAFDLWQREFSDNIFKPPTIGEMTSISSGLSIMDNQIKVDSPNKFPSTCIATFDVRTTPRFHPIAFKKIQSLAKKHRITIDYVYPPAPAGYTDSSEKIVKVARNILKDVKLTVAQGAADLGFLSELGIKSIILGPGEKDQQHVVNEFCYPAQIPKAVKIYQQIIKAWAK